MPAPPRPMQPRPSLVVGGPAYFTPEGYQAPVQPEQAFMPTDRRPDPIGDNFRRPYERPIMPMPSPTPPPEMAQPAPPRVPIEQPKETLPVDPGPIETLPVMPEPTPQPKYDPYAPSEMGARIAAGASAYRVEGDPSSGYLMNIYWMDDQGRIQNTTEGWSRVPKQFRNKVYRTREEADEAAQMFREYQDTGGTTTPTPKRTPVTTPAPAPVVEAPVFAGGPGGAKTMPDSGRDELGDYMIVGGEKMRFTTQPITIPKGNVFTDMRLRDPSEAKSQVMPDSLLPMPSPIDMEAVNASLAEYGITPKIPSVPAPVVPPTVPQPMPSMPSLPSLKLPTLPTLGGRPSLTRPIMRVNPRER